MLAPPGADDLADVVGFYFHLAPHPQQAQLDGGPGIETDTPPRLTTQTYLLPAESYRDIAESPGCHHRESFRQCGRPRPQKQGAVLGGRNRHPTDLVERHERIVVVGIAA